MTDFFSGPLDPFWVAKMTLVAAVTNIVILTASVLVLYKQFRNTHLWHRFLKAHDLTREFNLGRVQEIRQKLEKKAKIYDMNETYTDKAGVLDDDDRSLLDAVLNFFENLMLAVENGVADNAVVRENVFGVAAAYWRWAKPYVDDCRKTISPELWRYIEPRLEQWEIEEAAGTRRIKELDARIKRKIARLRKKLQVSRIS